MAFTQTIPTIMQSEERFNAEATFYATCIIKAHTAAIQRPIALYGQHIAAGTRAGREISVEFYHALATAKLPGYGRLTAQLADYPDIHARFEDAIAHRVWIMLSAEQNHHE